MCIICICYKGFSSPTCHLASHYNPLLLCTNHVVSTGSRLQASIKVTFPSMLTPLLPAATDTEPVPVTPPAWPLPPPPSLVLLPDPSPAVPPEPTLAPPPRLRFMKNHSSSNLLSLPVAVTAAVGSAAAGERVSVRRQCSSEPVSPSRVQRRAAVNPLAEPTAAPAEAELGHFGEWSPFLDKCALT